MQCIVVSVAYNAFNLLSSVGPCHSLCVVVLLRRAGSVDVSFRSAVSYVAH